MAFTIPAGTFDNYFEVVDELIANTYIGVDLTLFYTETITSVIDTSHRLNLVDGPPTNFGPDGNLTPFNPQAGGTTFSQVESSESIRSRWYPDPKEWKKIVHVEIPEVKVVIITKMVNWEKIQRANQIGYTFGGLTTRYMLATAMQPWGFGDRYLVAQLKGA